MSWHGNAFHITYPWWGETIGHLEIPITKDNLDSKVHGAVMGPTWGRQDPGGPHVGPMNLAILEVMWSSGVSLADNQKNGQ